MSETIKLCAMVARHDQSEWSDDTREAWVAQACRARDEHDAFRKGEKAADAEIERLRAENTTLSDANIERVAEVMKLRAENAAFGEALRVLQGGDKTLRDLTEKDAAELEWFRRREPSIRAVFDSDEDCAAEALLEWEIINPKPGAGT